MAIGFTDSCAWVENFQAPGHLQGRGRQGAQVQRPVPAHEGRRVLELGREELGLSGAWKQILQGGHLRQRPSQDELESGGQGG